MARNLNLKAIHKDGQPEIQVGTKSTAFKFSRSGNKIMFNDVASNTELKPNVSNITYGTSELTAGSSSLSTGDIYICYS